MSTRSPLRFEVQMLRVPNGDVRIDSTGRTSITGGAPPEFGGTPARWGPEHLLLSAAGSCFVTTFEWFARRAALPIGELSCEATGTVERMAGGLGFSSIHLEVRLSVPAGEAARARELLATAKRSCLVANSLRVPVDLDAEVSEGEGAGAPA